MSGQMDRTEAVIADCCHCRPECIEPLAAHARDLARKLVEVMEHTVPALLDLCYCEEAEEHEQCDYCERIERFRTIVEPAP